ncbi:hypothetical protein POJ06DRAFT_261049 [Lipomyces tetrasporus]|uniref:Protein transport protein SEC31 n=1 Tax=Lipomyces tetrasporus TaxID=54092 RepID=A0AAD7VPY4_9ASCO|nr:uncharacterized protein POJ06DRAFT_261049 [Lipomyces tetrasporus]KAJ8097316.1 hypothetical protein POJ06DRAFT_261049 [Lipomyces tetrasporus]
MVKLKEIPRTATFAWSPGPQLPFIATGTVAGAVDADFSSKSTLELWDLNLVDKSTNGFQLSSPVVTVGTEARFHDLIWGGITASHPSGIIAGAQENGTLMLWDPEALLKDASTGTLLSKVAHSAAIKSLDFNPIQANILASGGSKGEILVWDLDKPNMPLKPGAASSRLDEVESVAWNSSVPHILATAGNTGFTSIWDLKNKREVLHLFYPGTGGGGRRGVSSAVWHPDNSTKLITASEDDSSPVILMWDLRNANAPEKVLSGHDKGILSLSWCKRDCDLLLSSGKDNRTLLWNPQSGELLGEFPIATNWTFETQWYSRNPELFASASFDGKITVQSLQNTNKTDQVAAEPKPEGIDFWDRPSYVDTQQPTFSLKQPPKWLRRTVGASFGFGGKLVSLQLDKSPTETAKSMVKVNRFVIEPKMASETEKFEEALNSQNLAPIAETRAETAALDKDKHDWKVLLALYESNPKRKIVDYLGYTPEQMEDLFKKFDGMSLNVVEEPQPVSGDSKFEPEESSPENTKPEASDSMFGDSSAADPFLSSISQQPTLTNGTADALYGPTGPFAIFSSETAEADKFIAQALVLGNFSAAVDICLKDDRLSDAFMLALSGDDECRNKVQQAYFRKNTNGPPYIRVLSSIVGKNLADLVANADIENWKEVVVALCTFATDAEFNSLIAELGERLCAARTSANSEKSLELRQSAALCFLAGSELGKLINIWIEELAEEEKEALRGATGELSPFGIHIKSLQDFIEKVTVFRNAVKYTDAGDRTGGSDSWSLAPLYEAYREYANIVASQGFLDLAQKYLALLPTQYPLASLDKERVVKAAAKAVATPPTATTDYASRYGNAASTSFYGQMLQAPAAAPVATATAKSAYVPASNPYQQTAPATAAPPAPASTYEFPSSRAYGHSYRSSVTIPAPPPPVVSPPTITHQQAPVPPPPANAGTGNHKDAGGWNDAPVLKSSGSSRKATPSAVNQPIMSPFPGHQPLAPGQTPYAPAPSSSPALGRPPTTNIGPPPANAKAPQSMTVSPVQSPPVVKAAVNVQVPQVGFVSVGQPAVGMASTAPPTGSTIPPPPSEVAVPPPTAASKYAPLPSTAQPARPTNPYAPPSLTQQQPPQRPPNPYAPVAPPPSAAAPPSAPPQTSLFVPPPPAGAYTPSVPHARGPSSIARTASPAQSVGAPASAAQPPKYPSGDRSHITGDSAIIYEILNAEMARVKQKIPPSVARQVNDAEKRLNILFDHLNNSELLTEETIREMVILAKAMKARDFETAYAVHINLLTTRTDECGHWMVGVKRLIDVSRQC